MRLIYSLQTRLDYLNLLLALVGGFPLNSIFTEGARFVVSFFELRICTKFEFGCFCCIGTPTRKKPNGKDDKPQPSPGGPKSPLGNLARMALAEAGSEDVDEERPKAPVFSKGTGKVHPMLSELMKKKRESQAAALVHPSPAGYVDSINSDIESGGAISGEKLGAPVARDKGKGKAPMFPDNQV